MLCVGVRQAEKLIKQRNAENNLYKAFQDVREDSLPLSSSDFTAS